MFITVVIPAFNRPNLLRIAIQSIREQTAKSSISRIIVSENGLNPSSKEVCDEFADLPITYILQQPQLPVLSHLKWLMSQEQQGYVALLCDDDWWNPYHLEIAIRSLKEHKECIAYFSNFVYSDNELSLRLQLYHGLRVMHVGRPDFSNTQLTVYQNEDILALSFLITPFHFSAMVCDGKILSQAVEIFDSIHPTYADRMLWAVLSSYGEILFNPLNTTIVRIHEEMDSKRYSSLEWKQQAQEGSLRVLEFAESKGYNVKDKINFLYNSVEHQDMNFIYNEMDTIFVNKEQIKWFAGYNIMIERALQVKRNQSSIRTVAGKIIRRIIKVS